ncbi:MAG: hypothetical protein FK734_02835 [Asgard group archaeon]|nr:hypothetical protein [Asgard group archaeon]
MAGKKSVSFYCLFMIIWLIVGFSISSKNNTLIFSKVQEMFPTFDICGKIIPDDLIEHAPIYINSNDDFETCNLSGEGTKLEPYLITKFNITTIDEIPGIHIEGVTVYFEISECLITSEYISILVGNIATGIGYIGNNTCISSSGDGGGIVLGSLNNCTIENNECAYFMQGIHLNGADNCKITSNRILSNNYQGINLRYSNNNIVTHNQIENSDEFGLTIVGSTSSGNIIHHNFFVNNSKATEYNIDGERTGIITSQGYDEGINNFWYDELGKYGNHWSDYNGRGSYTIDGPAEAVDLYPLFLSETESISLSIILFPLAFLTMITSAAIFRRKRT